MENNLAEQISEKIAEAFKQIRVDENLTQREVAQILNITENTISNWENNRTISPSLVKFIELAARYDYDLNPLLDEIKAMIDK